MDKEMKGLVVEIISLILLLIIIVPICVNASSNYRNLKEQMLSGNRTVVDISNQGDIKKIIVTSDYHGECPIRLMLKISKIWNILKMKSINIIIWVFMKLMEKGFLIFS